MTEQLLLLARDRLGKKPLVYADLPGVFLFASELKALLKHPAIQKEIDYTAIDHYLTYQYIPSPLTIFKSACQRRHRLQIAASARWFALWLCDICQARGASRLVRPVVSSSHTPAASCGIAW